MSTIITIRSRIRRVLLMRAHRKPNIFSWFKHKDTRPAPTSVPDFLFT